MTRASPGATIFTPFHATREPTNSSAPRTISGTPIAGVTFAVSTPPATTTAAPISGPKMEISSPSTPETLCATCSSTGAVGISSLSGAEVSLVRTGLPLSPASRMLSSCLVMEPPFSAFKVISL